METGSILLLARQTRGASLSVLGIGLGIRSKGSRAYLSSPCQQCWYLLIGQEFGSSSTEDQPTL